MFKPKILTRFLLRRFFLGVGIILSMICGVIFVITFVERLPMNPDAASALLDAWARLLEYMPMFLPMAVFMGTLLAFYNLTKSSEGIIISGAGISPFQFARPFLFGAAFLGIIVTTLVNPYSVNLSLKNITAENLALVDDTIWLREASDTGFTTMRAKEIQVRQNTLYFEDATVFQQGPDFKVKQRAQAKFIILSDSGFDAKNAKVWDSNGVMTKSDWHANTLLNPKTVLDRYLQPDQISFWDLPGFIKKMQDIGAPVRGHLIQFFTLLFLPLTLMSLTLLAIAFSQTRQRRNFNFIVKFGVGVITCFVLYFLLNLFSALAATGTLPPLLAIIAPPFIIIAGAGAFISNFDTI